MQESQSSWRSEDAGAVAFFSFFLVDASAVADASATARSSNRWPIISDRWQPWTATSTLRLSFT